jgi:hypothetical protein
LLATVMGTPHPPPSTIEEWIPAAVDEVFERALAKHPAHRFDSAVALIDALERALEHVR